MNSHSSIFFEIKYTKSRKFKDEYSNFLGKIRRSHKCMGIRFKNSSNFLMVPEFSIFYPNFPDVEANKKAAYVNTYPTEKCAKPTRRACTIDNATGLSRHITKLARGVFS